MIIIIRQMMMNQGRKCADPGSWRRGVGSADWPARTVAGRGFSKRK